MGTLELQNLTYSYDKKKKVLRGIDARMEAGKMYAILGPSGCGKTTLLSLLGGLDSPTSGAILFEGKDVAQTGLAGHRKKNVSFIFQSYNLIDYMTPQENVRLISKKTSISVSGTAGVDEGRNKTKRVEAFRRSAATCSHCAGTGQRGSSDFGGRAYWQSGRRNRSGYYRNPERKRTSDE